MSEIDYYTVERSLRKLLKDDQASFKSLAEHAAKMLIDKVLKAVRDVRLSCAIAELSACFTQRQSNAAEHVDFVIAALHEAERASM